MNSTNDIRIKIDDAYQHQTYIRSRQTFHDNILEVSQKLVI